MMGYYNGGWGMMGGSGLLGGIICLIVIIDLMLVGVWLWKQINK